MNDQGESTRDTGTTLVELVVTVAILGVAFAAILGGMSTSSIASDQHRKQATAETVLRSLAESVKRQPYTCPGAYTAGQITVPAGYVASVDQVQYWDGSTPLTPSRFSPTPPACGNDRGIQIVVLSVSSSGGGVREQLQVLKRSAP